VRGEKRKIRTDESQVDKGYFRIAFVFGEKAVAAVEKSDLPDSIKKDVADTWKYAEGRGIRLEVKRPQDADNVIKLIDIKVGG